MTLALAFRALPRKQSGNDKRRPKIWPAICKVFFEAAGADDPAALKASVAPALVQEQAFTLSTFAGQFAGATHGFGLFAGFLFGRLFEVAPQLHFPEDAFALHLLLEHLQGLIDIVVANLYLHASSSRFLPSRRSRAV